MKAKLKTKQVYSRTITVDGHTFLTEIRKPLEYYDKWQVCTSVSIDGQPKIKDYRTHFIDGAGMFDSEVVSEQLLCIEGRMFAKYRDLIPTIQKWSSIIHVDFASGALNGWDFEL